MRALSLHQPWAELIISGRKRWETRGWSYLPTSLVGETLAIHAAKRRSRALDDIARRLGIIDPGTDELPRGAIVGTVRVTEVRTLTDADQAGALCACDGLVGIRCKDPLRLPKPIPWRGRQGFFTVDLGYTLPHGPSTLAAMLEQCKAIDVLAARRKPIADLRGQQRLF